MPARIPTLAIMIAAPMLAMINPQIARQRQQNSPEKLVVRIESIRTDRSSSGNTLRFQAKVLEVEKSATGLKVGASIPIAMSEPNYRPTLRFPSLRGGCSGVVPTAPMVVPVRGRAYVSYLERYDDGIYWPTTLSGFEPAGD